MLLYYEGQNKPKQNNIDFESAREILMLEDYKMVVKRRFVRIYNMMECKSYMKNEDIPENKEIFIHGFKHVKTDKIHNSIIIGCESGELYEKEKLFSFWSNKFMNKEIEMSIFTITGWCFMSLVKRNNFFKIQGVCS